MSAPLVWLRRWVTATAILMVLGAMPQALAAVQPTPDASIIDEAPGDPALVRSIQERLTALGLFDGAIDGKMSLALGIAVRAAQEALRLPVDGRVTAELLAALAGIVNQAEALRARLEEVRARQTGEARELLLNSAATRDLVGGTVVGQAPTLRACGMTAETACLIAPALASLDLIDEADRRDWVLAGLARALTRDGEPALARGLIARIADPRTIVTALGDMAVAYAEAGDVRAAIAAADAVPGADNRLKARIAAALALLARGDAAAAARLVAPIVGDLERAATTGENVVLLAGAAGVMAGSGDAAAAATLLERAEALASDMTTAHDHDLALGTLAQTLAEMGAVERASAVVETIDDPWRQAPLFARIVAAAAERGALADAALLAERVSEPRYRATAEARLAGAFGRAGLIDEGAEMLDVAERTSRQVPRGFARSFALASVAVAAGELGQMARAQALAESVPDRRLRSQALMKLAGLMRTRGDHAEAGRLEFAAIDQALAIVDPVERAAARAELVIQGVTREGWSDIVADAMALDEPWQRARSLASLAAIAVRLADQGGPPAP